jgi:glycoprotein endo-alpha-1,2-mannosidase
VDGAHTLRRTKHDAAVIGLWVWPWDGPSLLAGGFDGFYTYFGCEGFSYGSTVANWPALARFAERKKILVIPSVAPGYIDTRIRPLNGRNTRLRQGGAFYDRMFAAALDTKSQWISITSYNEWHEGTQIEPAVPMKIDSFTYDDYSPDPPDFYLKRTREWVDRLKEAQAAPSASGP